MKIHIKLIAVFVLAAFLIPTLGTACPFCKEALGSNNPDGSGFGRGIYYSILLILGLFYGMVALLIRYIVKQARKQTMPISSEAPKAVEAAKTPGHA